jgi:hypothetical protein
VRQATEPTTYDQPPTNSQQNFLTALLVHLQLHYANMFKGLASEISGSSDVCKVIGRQQLQQDPLLSYLLPHETAYFMFKSTKEV